MFSMIDDDVIVLIDVGTCMFNSQRDVTGALLSLVSSGMIGRFRVSNEGFSLRQIGIDSGRRECSKLKSVQTLATSREKLTTKS